MNVGSLAADSREAVAKEPAASAGWECKAEEHHQSYRSDQFPGTVVEDSIDSQYRTWDCSCCLDIRRGDPFWRAKRSKHKLGGSDF